jgi:cellulose biosynthesis protein BcsQ
MSKIIVLFSTKGGVGKTLVASNLAVSLAKDESKRVLLMDLDLQAVGDMARMLDLNPQRAIVDFYKCPTKKTPVDKKRRFHPYILLFSGLHFIIRGIKASAVSPYRA